MSNEPLQIDNIEFMVTSQIDRAPKWTMFRELTMNAVEAAIQAGGDEKLVKWTVGTYEGYRKAVIWNNGPGMDKNELKQSTNLACQINKKLGLDNNFGMGAKISSLASNKMGIRYRSCKNQTVYELMLCYDEERNVYVRHEYKLDNGTRDTVINVTTAAKKEHDITQDWTEVMLLGNSIEQDTAACPFEEKTTKTFVADSLYRRFYRLPSGLILKMHEVYQRFDKERRFETISERYDKFKKHETVECSEHNLKIHFLHDPENPSKTDSHRLSRRGALASATTTCCLIHKDEMYDVKTGIGWSAIAPQFGIPFGSKELCVHIELGEDAARPSHYRDYLITKSGGEKIHVEEYASTVRANMPEWVLDVIKSASPKQSEDFSNVQNRLQKLLDLYKTRNKARRLDVVNGQDETGNTSEFTSSDEHTEHHGKSTSNNTDKKRRYSVPEGALPTSEYMTNNKAPEIIMLTTHEDVSERALTGKGAEYIKETGKLFINGLYDAVERTLNDLEPELLNLGDQELVRETIIHQARQAMSYRVGKAVVFAMAKRNDDNWSDDDMIAATTKESLSLPADNYEESLTEIRKAVKDAIKVSQIVAA